MIDLTQGVVVQESKARPIKEWVVWFRTMRGLHTDLVSALADAADSGMPVELIRPVPVAITTDGWYEESIK